jgi:hypothetical protein
MSSEMSFRSILVLSICEGVKLSRLGEYQLLKSKLKDFIHFIEFIASHKMSFSSNYLDFRKISNFRQIWMKIETPPFSKIFMGFVREFEWIILKLSKFQ